MPLIRARPSLAVRVSGSIDAAAEPLGRRDALARGRQDLALSHQRQATVSERHEIPAGAERAMLGNHRVEPCRKQGEQRFGNDRARPGAAHRQRAGAEEHHRAHHLALDGRPHARRVRADQRTLKLLAALGGIQVPASEPNPVDTP